MADDDPLKGAIDKATGGAPKSAATPFTYYSPEAKAARTQGMLDSLGAINDANKELKTIYNKRRRDAGSDIEPNYAKGGPVGKIGTFGMKRSKPDFAAGGSVMNRKTWSK